MSTQKTSAQTTSQKQSSLLLNFLRSICLPLAAHLINNAKALATKIYKAASCSNKMTFNFFWLDSCCAAVCRFTTAPLQDVKFIDVSLIPCDIGRKFLLQIKPPYKKLAAKLSDTARVKQILCYGFDSRLMLFLRLEMMFP